MLAGKAVIAIWNGVEPGARADFYAWHDTEHIPERVAIPGFLRGRRYVAVDPETSPEFFTLYEVRDFSVIEGAEYKDRLDHPTAWTRAVTGEFRGTERALARVIASRGPGVGGTLLTLRFPESGEAAEPLHHAIADVAAAAGVTGVHLCTTDVVASRVRSNESRERRDIVDPPTGFILVEGIGKECLVPCSEKLERLFGATRPLLRRGFYRLEYLSESSPALA